MMKTWLLLHCVECKAAARVAFGPRHTFDTITKDLRAEQWVLSVVTAPGDGLEPTLAPLCGACAKKIYPPELLDAARKAKSS